MSEQPEPAGFGSCRVCPYMLHGPAKVCHACAQRSMTTLPRASSCPTCAAALEPDGSCRNKICNWTVDERYFSSVYAIASHTGELRRAIRRYKYRGRYGWALIFGRVVAGYLEANFQTFIEYDAIVPSPTYVAADGRSRDHIGAILRVAETESFIPWSFRYDLVRKTRATRSMADAPSWHERLRIAQVELRPALEVPDPSQVAGQHILVFDDVFTGGHTLSEVARALRLADAREVSELVLARQPWGS